MRTISSHNRLFTVIFIMGLLMLSGCGQSGLLVTVPPCTGNEDTCVSYAVPGKLFPVKQTYRNACWAAAYTMLRSWEKQSPQNTEQLLQPLGDHYLQLYKQSDIKGISQDDEKAFYLKAGLEIEYQLEPSIKGWASYLKDYGPLSITIDAKPPFGGSIDALLLLGIYGGINGQHTTIVYIDPADGLLHKEPFMDFLPKYEALMAVDWPLQIIHLPKNLNGNF